jgi:HEAT repeat protein
VVLAGHRGEAGIARSLLDDDDALVRQGALAALVRLGVCESNDLERAFGDPSPVVRARAAELAAAFADIDLRPLLADTDATVVEVAGFSCGERQWLADPPIAELSEIAMHHDDALCRESAAAALGAIGHPDGLDAVLIACADRVTVRRRATLALAAFDDPRAQAALETALADKDWQVRQAAEDLLEVGRTLDGPADPDAYAFDDDSAS